MEMTPYELGAKAFYAGKSEADNPYNMNDDFTNFQSWLGGWLSGLHGVVRVDTVVNSTEETELK